MQFILSVLALAAAAIAVPTTSQVIDATDFPKYNGETILISLPDGCTNTNLASKYTSEARSLRVLELITNRVRFALDRHNRFLRRCHHRGWCQPSRRPFVHWFCRQHRCQLR